MEGEQRQVQGTVFRGADGTLYFIPSDWLEALRVPEQDTVEDAVEQGGTDQVRVSDATVEAIAHAAGPARILGTEVHVGGLNLEKPTR